jgi:hypothetical protein
MVEEKTDIDRIDDGKQDIDIRWAWDGTGLGVRIHEMRWVGRRDVGDDIYDLAWTWKEFWLSYIHCMYMRFFRYSLGARALHPMTMILNPSVTGLLIMQEMKRSCADAHSSTLTEQNFSHIPLGLSFNMSSQPFLPSLTLSLTPPPGSASLVLRPAPPARPIPASQSTLARSARSLHPPCHVMLIF